MTALFLIFLFIDALITFHLYRQAFVVRSNMRRKNQRRFLLMIAVMGASVIVYNFNLSLACLIAGIPACLVTLFVGALAVAMITHKGPWH